MNKKWNWFIMNKMWIIISFILWFILISWMVYATVTVANINKSTYLPWQWIPQTVFDSAHNVWSTYLPEARLTFSTWSSVGWTSVVYDSVTKLSWQSNWNDAWTPSWHTAKIYCNDLVLWWENDWRVPNIKELTSIVDYNLYSPNLDTFYFTNAAHTWTSTEYPSNNTLWIVFRFDNWTISFQDKNNASWISVRCVR